MPSPNGCSSPAVPSVLRPYCFGLPGRSDANRNDSETGEIGCHLCIHFLECQDAYPSRPKVLTLGLKHRFFDAIRSGTKREEYREFKDYWVKRLEGTRVDVIELVRGRPVDRDPSKRMWFRFDGYRVENMTWMDGDLAFNGPTIIIPLNRRLHYPYQVIEERKASSSKI